MRKFSAFIFLLLLIVLSSFSNPEGLYYQHITTDAPLSVHVLQVDPKKFTIAPARALDKCVGRETVLSLSIRKGAIGAINGGFFSIDKHEGSPCGILKIAGEWFGLPTKPRGAIGWSSNGEGIIFDRVLTHQEGIDFIVDPQNNPSTALQWNSMDHIVGGAPLLIQNGKKIANFTSEMTIETFLTLRHARTAIGVLPNGHWVFVVVDGKQPDFSVGMTINELSDFMDSLGCIDALNLDGGGSSTFVFQNQVINQPTGDGDEKDDHVRVLRRVSDAILILER